ncbi:thioesterase II family protein [Amycolatopsis sp. NPDC058278]|uniref:thioesterase II family protein n=1 Tax=Amycolatopsis sp. NPDC058278 TaxID=3346417 RepID=UPI0036DD0C6C
MTGNDAASWVRVFHPNPDAALRIVCFPHAGGAAPFFHSLSQALSGDFEVLSLQYPGRQDRRSEPFIDDIHVLADRVAKVLCRWTDRPLIFFGHSMGATLAYETALRLEPVGAGPTALFVSSRRSPNAVPVELVHLRDDRGLLDEVKGLSGTESWMFDDPEIVEMILPVLRNDYRAVETYRHRPHRPLACPIFALVGDRDPKVAVDDMRDWRNFSAAGFELNVFPGGHFYLTDNQEAVVQLLSRVAKA